MGAPGTTEGPWMAAASPSSVVGWPVVGSQGRAIANITWMPKPDHVDAVTYAGYQRECKANAHQIAASGALYDALAAELADIEEDIQWAATSDLDRLIKRRERAEAALALARGEQPTPHGAI